MGYDNASRLVSESLTAYGQTYTVGSAFDAAGRKTSITYPDGKIVTRGYTDRDQLESIVYDASLIDTRTYDAGGRLATSLYGNVIGTTWSYRNDNLVSSITRTNLTGADFSYTYDANKNKTSETISGVMADYGFSTTSYDDQDRLTSWNRTDGNLDQSWNLSKEGDWNAFTENGTTENRSHTEVHELTAIDATPLLYDAKGNLTQNSNGQTYTWDFDNRMASATVPVGSAEGIEGTHGYTYDALGRRVSKSVDDGGTTMTTVFVSITEPFEHSPVAGQVMSEYAGGVAAGGPTRSFVYGEHIDEPVVLIDSPGVSEQRYYYHTNSLHSVATITNEVTGVVERYGYAAYGSVTICDASGMTIGGDVSSIGNRYTFSGRRRDDETGLFYYRARSFDHRQGRFVGRDPVQYTDANNLYQYVLSRPLHASDPTGFATVNTNDIRKRCQGVIDRKKKRNAWPPPPTTFVGCGGRMANLRNHPRVKDILDQLATKPGCTIDWVCTCCHAWASFSPTRSNGKWGRIKLCWNNVATMSNAQLAEILRHELVHAGQFCFGRNTKRSCMGSMKREMEAYFCSKSCVDAPSCLKRALASSCGGYCSDPANDLTDSNIQKLLDWFNTHKKSLCKFGVAKP